MFVLKRIILLYHPVSKNRHPGVSSRGQGPARARPSAIHGCGPCPAMNEYPTRTMDVTLSQIEALIEIYNSR